MPFGEQACRDTRGSGQCMPDHANARFHAWRCLAVWHGPVSDFAAADCGWMGFRPAGWRRMCRSGMRRWARRRAGTYCTRWAVACLKGQSECARGTRTWLPAACRRRAAAGCSHACCRCGWSCWGRCKTGHAPMPNPPPFLLAGHNGGSSAALNRALHSKCATFYCFPSELANAPLHIEYVPLFRIVLSM